MADVLSAPAVTSVRHRPIQLKFDGGQVRVIPEDQDSFVLSSQKAVEACKRMVTFEAKYVSLKEDVLRPLHEWCMKRSSQVASCYIGEPQGGTLPVFVVGKKEEYDFDLLPDLARLDLQFRKAEWTVVCHQLPAGDLETLSTFFDPETALQVYAELAPA